MDRTGYQQRILPLKNKLFRFAKSFLKSEAEAEDAVQEVLIKLWDQRESLDRVNHLEAWCMRVMRNWCLDRLKSKKHRVIELQEAVPMSHPGADPGRQAEWKDAYESVKAIMRRLPEGQRTVLQLREVEQLSYKEIVEATGMSMESVKVNLFRARKTVRARYTNLAAYGS
jgi:RNA polymerase sigma-70 factor (ECF subfamily)